MEKYNVFPTLILKDKAFLSKEKCKLISSLLNNNKNQLKPHGAFIGRGLSSHSVNSNMFLDKDIMNNIKIKCKIFAKDNGFYFKNIITESWFNIQGKGSILKEHTHPNSLISGILFIKTDKHSSNIYFHNPNPYVYYTKQTDKNNIYSNECISFKPEIGTLIIFPSWLKHGSYFTENKSIKRIIFSFNVI
tara:strand:- start:55 stop:624 length:570 start_codon:yes stop_codon:yes gene_type:complete